MSESTREIESKLGIGGGRRHWKAYVLLAVALAMAAMGLWYLRASSPAHDTPIYTTEAASRGDLVITVTATGSVEPTNLVDISSELSGTLTEVLVDYNDTVVAGQVLAKLNTAKLEAEVAVRQASLSAANAMVEKASASLTEAQLNYDTALQLDERGATTRNSVLTTEAALQRARADLEVARADVALAAANLEVAEAELDKACICSPINGVVLDRQADAGQIVAASLSAPTLFTVAEDLAKMELQVAVDEADIGRLATGNHATFTVDAFDEREFPADIAKIRYAPETVEGVVTYLATLNVDNSDLLLRPGMTATAEIVVNEVTDALLVSNTALRFRPTETVSIDDPEEDDGSGGSGLIGLIMPGRPGAETNVARSMNTVWVLRDGQAVEVTIEPGDSDGRHTEVRGGDLSEGDLVITREAG